MYYSLPLRRRTDMNSYHQKIHEKRYTKTRTCEAKVTKRSLEKVTNLVSLSYKKKSVNNFKCCNHSTATPQINTLSNFVIAIYVSRFGITKQSHQQFKTMAHGLTCFDAQNT